jgi:hypothetical protein
MKEHDGPQEKLEQEHTRDLEIEKEPPPFQKKADLGQEKHK